LVVFFSLSAFAATIGFEPGSQIVPVGESVSVNLVISGLGDGESPSLAGFDLFIEYDPTILALSDPNPKIRDWFWDRVLLTRK